MKKTIQFLTILAIVFSFTSCDELTDVDFDTTMTERIDVNIANTEGEAAAFTANSTMRLSDGSGDIDDYINYIKEVEVKKLTYKIINFSGDENGEITVNFKVNGNLLKEHAATNAKSVADSGEIFEITDIQELTSIATALENSQQIQVSYAGEATTNDVMNFKVEVTLEAAITADPI